MTVPRAAPAARAARAMVGAAALALAFAAGPADALDGLSGSASMRDAELAGPLVAADLPPQHPAATLALQMQAQSADLVVREFTWQGGITSVDRLATASTATGHLEGMAANGISRSDVAFTVLPLQAGSAQLEVAATCLAVEAADGGTARFVDRTGADPSPPSLTSELDGSLAAGLCDGTATIRVHGDFQMSLWNLDIEAHGQGDNGTYRSGEELDAVHPAACPGACTVTKRQAYITVHAGHAEIAGIPLATALLHADALQGTASSLALAAGGSQPPAAQAGDLAVALAAEGGQVRIVAGPAGAAPPTDPDAAVATGMAAWGWTAGLLAAVAAPGAVVGAAALRSRRAARRLDDAEALLAQGLPREAVRVARPLLRRRRWREEAAYVAVQALCEAGAHADASALVAKVWPADKPMAAYLRAYVEAAQGRLQAAVQELSACLSAAPGFLPEVRSEPLFRRALQSPALARWVRTPSPGYW